MCKTRPLVEPLANRSDRVIQSARSRLMAMHEVISLMGQIVQWISTGEVAANKIGHVGFHKPRHCAQQGGQEDRVWLGLSDWPLAGAICSAPRIAANADERQMPLKALAEYRDDLWQEATPERVVYDRGGDATATRERLASEGVRKSGFSQRKRPWSVAEGVRDQMRSARGQTEGSLDFKKPSVQFNKPKSVYAPRWRCRVRV